MKSSDLLRRSLIPLFVALLAILIFANSLKNDFVWDDRELIVDNPAVHGLSEVSNFFTDHFWSESRQPSAQGYYRPLILISYALDYSIWKLNPLGFHLTNILWHALASALLCLIVMKFTSSNFASLLAGSLFAVHPAHVESVAFVSGRTDIIATALALLSAVVFFGGTHEKRSVLRLALSILCFGLALLAKEVAAVLPLLLLIGDAVLTKRHGVRLRFSYHAGHWLILALYLVGRFGLLGIRPQLEARPDTLQLLLTMPVVVIDYFRMLVAPFKLCADYTTKFNHNLNMSILTAIIGALFAFGTVTALVFKRKESGFFGAWILLGLLPVLQIIPISVLKAERFLYLPSVGFCALIGLIALLISNRLDKSAQRFLVGLFVFLIIGLSIRTTMQNKVWRDEFTLYKTTAACAPDNFRVQYNLGAAYYHRGDLENALKHSEIAYRLRPSLPQVANNLGAIYADMNRPMDAETMYRWAIQLDPSYAWAHANLASLLYEHGRTEEARHEWTKTLSIDPNIEQAREGLRLLESQSGQRE